MNSALGWNLCSLVNATRGSPLQHYWLEVDHFVLGVVVNLLDLIFLRAAATPVPGIHGGALGQRVGRRGPAAT